VVSLIGARFFVAGMTEMEEGEGRRVGPRIREDTGEGSTPISIFPRQGGRGE